MTDLTPAGLRAARAILQWKLIDLERESGVAFSTIHAIEAGKRAPQSKTAEALISAFAAHGVELLPPPQAGARLRA